MLYFVQIAMFFEESSLKELGGIVKFKVIDRQLNNLIIETKENLLKAVGKKKTTFVYSVFPLYSKDVISKNDYLGSIHGALLKAVEGSGIDKGEVIRLECYDINSREGYSAKDLEVRLGKMLIDDGYTADLINPVRFVYLLLLNGVCYVGQEKYKNRVLNPLRPYSQTEHTSRAEMKIAEAFESFGISSSGIALDLGAAPGGWSKFLARNGFRVIAVDTAKLDYDSLERSGLKVAVNSKSIKKALNMYDIIHVNLRAADFLSKAKDIRIDLLADDMNMDCKSSSAEVLKYAPLMRKGSTLVMTIKCINRNAPKFMAQARKALSPKFSIKGIKVLPVNRQEMTLYAIRK